MRICWDNLEKHNIHLTMDGKFRNRETKILFIYRDSCIICQEPFLINPYSTGTCCSYKCSGKLRSKLLKGSKHTEETKKKLSEIGRGRNHTEESKRKIGNKSKGRKHTEETKRKMSDSAKGRNHTEETKKKLSEIVRGRKHTEESKRKMSEVQKCYYIQNNLPKYDLYAHKIEWCEPVKRNQKDRNILDVRCDYCGKWYVSTIISVLSRIKAIFGKISGESRFYCSDNCKQECPIFNRSKWPKGFKKDGSFSGIVFQKSHKIN